MQIKTISYIKQNAASLNVEEPIVVTQGEIRYIVLSEASARQRDEAIATLKLMNLAERDTRNQNLLSLSEAKERLEREISTKKFEL